MATGVLGTATSGLLAYQRSLSTTGHNIANASTPGYSRQRVEVTTQIPQSSGAGFIGSGVKATTVTRLFDQFLVDRVRSGTASTNSLDVYSQFASRVADLLSDADAGLNGSLETFFNSMQTLANDPTSIPARQLVLSEGESLTARFEFLNDQLSSTRDELNGQLSGLVLDVNTLSQGIADINQEIVNATGLSGGQPPNDLLDTRDQLLEELSALVSVSHVQQDDGSMNVFIGNGQSLVTGFSAATLSVQGNGFDATEMDIMYTVGGVSSDITANIIGGKLGGLLSFRDEVLDPAQNSLGRIAVVLGTALNEQNSQGMDLDGNLGGDLFSLAAPQVNGHINNAGTGTVTASFDNATINDLTTLDYIISYDGAAWNLTDADGTAVAMTGAGTGLSPFNVDGMNIVVGGTPTAGDRFIIRPTRMAADAIAVATNNVREIAAAAPVHITEATNASGVPTNAGTGQLAYSGVSSGFSALAGTITLTFNSGTNQLSYTDGGAVTGNLSYDPTSDSGTSFTVAGVSFTVTGTPSNADSFVLGNNASGSGDNSNALLLAGLQTGLTVEGGTTNFQGAYAQLISDVGTKARQAEIGYTVQLSMLRQAQADKEALSGVNLDEEAANLLRFQQAYQAMAQVVTVADSMFQTLLSAVRG